MPDTFALSGGLTGTATISECGLYRYDLTRTWGPTDSRVCFVMLNPSKADATRPDPTMTRCVGFAERMACDGLVIVNLFALRSTDPAELRRVVDPIGPLNDDAIRQHVATATHVICAWGAGGGLRGRNRQVLSLLRTLCVPLCLRMTKSGHPEHPLYLPASCEPFEMSEVAGA